MRSITLLHFRIMSDTANNPEDIFTLSPTCTQGFSLVAIRREAKKAEILITDEQIRDLILAARAKQEPEFDIEVYKRHL